MFRRNRGSSTSSLLFRRSIRRWSGAFWLFKNRSKAEVWIFFEIFRFFCRDWRRSQSELQAGWGEKMEIFCQLSCDLHAGVCYFRNFVVDRSRCSNVQATSMSTHSDDRKHLCVSRNPQLEFCLFRNWMYLTLLFAAATVLAALTRISSIQHSHTQAMRYMYERALNYVFPIFSWVSSFIIFNMKQSQCMMNKNCDLFVTTRQPTSMRAIRARYNPYLQTRHRVEQLKQLGHSVDKVEFIVMGGTFMALPEDYRDYFIRNLHDALSGHTSHSVAEAVKWERLAILGLTVFKQYCQFF